MNYRPEIDGLRAFAVVPVVTYHAGLSYFPGGFLGVDIFFVISGYLIARIINYECAYQRFSILSFYKKRAQRILPPLLLLLFACSLYSFQLPPFASRELSKHIISTILFAQNLLLAIESSEYFDLGSEFKPLLHMWTLSVEGQFYFLYPLIFLVLRNKKHIIIYFFVISAISFSAAVSVSDLNANYSFYALKYRVWEFLVGVIAGLLSANEVFRSVKKVNEVLSFIGITLILSSYVCFNAERFFFPWSILLPVVGAFLTILFATPGTLVNRILKNKLFVSIGLISYGIYLWHQPLMVFARNERAYFSETFSTGELTLILGLTLTMSCISYFLLENRNSFLREKYASNKASVIYSILFVLLAYLGYSTMGFEAYKLEYYKNNGVAYYISYSKERERIKKTDWSTKKNIGASVLIIGDSMSSDVQKALYSVGIPADRLELDGACFSQLVSIGAACGVDMNSIRNAMLTKKIVIIATDYIKNDIVDGVVALHEEIEKYNNALVMGGFRFKRSTDIAYSYIRSDKSVRINGYFEKHLDSRNSANETMKMHVGIEHFIDKKDMFCNSDGCELFDNEDRPLFYDSIHLTIEGWSYFGAKLNLILLKYYD